MLNSHVSSSSSLQWKYCGNFVPGARCCRTTARRIVLASEATTFCWFHSLWHLNLWLFRRMGDDRKKRSRSRSRDKKRKDRWFLSCWQFGIGSVGLELILYQISWKDPLSDVQRYENLFVTWYQRTSNLTYIVLPLFIINTRGPRSRSRERRRSRSKEKVKKTSSKRRSRSWQFLLVIVSC